MSQIKGKNTKPEILVRKYLHKNGYRFRIHYSKLVGKPDIVLPKYRIVIQVNGCFWHGHTNCKYFTLPKTRTEWWINKINKTKSRDKLNTKKLSVLGWKIITVWECQLKKVKREKTLLNLISHIDKN